VRQFHCQAARETGDGVFECRVGDVSRAAPKASIDDTLMMLAPLPLRRSSGSAARVTTNKCRRLVWYNASISSSLLSSSFLMIPRWLPTLLTSTSRPPNDCSISRIRFVTSGLLRTSVWTTRA